MNDRHDQADRRLTVRRRAEWPVALASALAVVGVVALPTVLPDPDPGHEDALLPVLPDPTGVDHAVEEQETVPAPHRITRVPNQPIVAVDPPAVPSPNPAPTAPAEVPVPAPPAPAPSEPPGPTADPELSGGPAIAVRADQVPTTVADLAGGELVEVVEVFGDADQRYAKFRLDGFATFFTIDRATGATPYSSCRDLVGRTMTCHRHPDGSVHIEATYTAPEVDGGSTSHQVTWWTVDGWEILASSSNAPDKEAPPTRPEPGLSIDQLLAVTGSDTWFG